MFSGSVTGAFCSGWYQISQFGSGELLRLLRRLLLLLEIDGTSARRDDSRRCGEIHSKVTSTLKGIVQGIVRRRASTLVGALAVEA